MPLLFLGIHFPSSIPQVLCAASGSPRRSHFICGLDNAILEKIFMNIKDVIEKLDLLLEED